MPSQSIKGLPEFFSTADLFLIFCDLQQVNSVCLGEGHNEQEVYLPAMNDTNIIDLYWSRNEQAIEETDKSYGSFLLRFSQRILENRQDAEENVNDTYMRTWESIPPHRPIYFRAFLGNKLQCPHSLIK